MKIVFHERDDINERETNKRIRISFQNSRG